jgi:hypothetical protein
MEGQNDAQSSGSDPTGLEQVTRRPAAGRAESPFGRYFNSTSLTSTLRTTVCLSRRQAVAASRFSLDP